MEGEDIELLRDYIANKSEPAFRALVERHVDMVYATALRQVRDAHLAQEATQAVFIALAKKASGLSPTTVLAGWLFRAAQFAGAKVQRTEARRKHWEHQAAQMEPIASNEESAWDQIGPHLNDALNQLKEPDRDALVLRFFESKSIAQVGSALGTGESATKMRIARALEQLREIFRTRGIVLPAALLLAALSTHAAPSAPTGLAATIATSALLKQTTTSLLTKGMLLLMTSSKFKIAVAAMVVLLLLSGTTALVTYQVIKYRNAEVAEAAEPAQVHGEPTITFATENERRDRLTRELPEGGRLRIVTVNGDVVSTNDVRRMQVVDANGTNTIEVSPAERGTLNVRRFHVRKPAVSIDANGAAEVEVVVPATPAPTPR